jgi:uncharacterized protein (TIGR02246 family)
MTDRTTTLDDLARRVQRLEDEVAVARLVASYGPLVDAADADGAAALWRPDGSYDVEGWHMASSDEVRAMVASPEHRGLVERGCVHFLGPVATRIDGDVAVAVCESVLVLHREGRFTVARAGANRFELARDESGWRITRRVTRALDGSPEAVALLALES